MAKPTPIILGFLGFFLLSLLRPSSSDPSIHDLLRSNGLPAGLLPKAIRSYTLDDSGRLEVILDRPCLTKFETRVFFDVVVRANLSYAALKDVVGLSQEELFLWLPVKDIIVDDPKSGLILFDIGVAHKQLSRSLFDDPPDCKPEGDGVLSLRSGLLGNGGRKVNGFVAKRV
ncbi:Serine protease 45 [Cinnamomum micranthum f. kanehirae]|uniref:Serine protease 45 n=1 Tax=Cinnamomum micranthum f. kanehirae TaxID=337451 RepID=A0A3S3QV02_9MAGN|nr:Serine protease 45 [Cinnamomum micranthum f. kanehirae]